MDDRGTLFSNMKSFRLANRINRRFSKIAMCNARRCLTCHHISCKSTITSSINGNRYGIQIDKDVDWNSSNLIYVITWEARGCGAQYVGETSQSLKGRFRSHSFKIRNNSRRKYKNFLYDHFIKYNHSIENVTITPVEILSKQPGDSKNDMKKRRLSAELNWIKRLQTMTHSLRILLALMTRSTNKGIYHPFAQTLTSSH